jgi:hypothetical protein
MILAILLASTTFVFCWLLQGYAPESDIARDVAAWIVLIYLGFQLYVLGEAAARRKEIGLLGVIFAIIPLTTAMIILVLWSAKVWHLSGFQFHYVGLVALAGLIEFIMTLRFRSLIDQVRAGGWSSS